MNERSTVAEPLRIFDVATGVTREIHFGAQILPRGDAVNNTSDPALAWNADGRFVSIELEARSGLGVIIDAINGRLVAQLGRTPRRMRAEAALPEYVRWDFEVPIGYWAWRDFAGAPIGRLAWHPRDPSLLAVATESNRLILLNVDSLTLGPKTARVDIGRIFRRAPIDNPENLQLWALNDRPHELKWSPDGRYLLAVYTEFFSAQKQIAGRIFDAETATVVKTFSFEGTYYRPNHLHVSLSKIDCVGPSHLVVRDDAGMIRHDLDLTTANAMSGSPCEVALARVGFWGRIIQRIRFLIEAVAHVVR